MKVESPALWDIDDPNLYTFRLTVDGEVEDISVGFRSFRFDANKGFFLNGKHIKLRGACVHQDFGGVGVALTDNLQYYKIKKLKEMGLMNEEILRRLSALTGRTTAELKRLMNEAGMTALATCATDPIAPAKVIKEYADKFWNLKPLN